MQRKLIRTSFLAILMLFSLLLSGCGETPPPVHIIPFSFQNTEMSYGIDEPYMITLQYKNASTSVDEYVGLISCCGLDEDKQTLTERELLLEINPFYTAENNAENGNKTGDNSFDTVSMKSVTVEIPKSHLTLEKGYIQLFLRVYYGDQEDNSGFCLFNDIIHYEKIDGKIYFEKVK